MTTHTLFVCKSCSAVIDHDEVTEDTITEGRLLFDQLQAFPQSDPEHTLQIEAVGCLWTCDRPCSVTFACPGKYTYHFAGLHQANCVPELQQFSELYRQSADGYVKPPKMPGDLRFYLLVRVPPVRSF